jgi:hypothetical protein
LPTQISDALRALVCERAQYRCEYCLLHEEDSYSHHQIDHIVSRKHGGVSSEGNLAYCCLRCNLWKGTDIGSLSARTGKFIALFNPRSDRWSGHFRLDGAIIAPLTEEGEVTARLLKLNLDKRVAERRLLIAVGRYSIPG